jgi:hypothetical protein
VVDGEPTVQPMCNGDPRARLEVMNEPVVEMTNVTKKYEVLGSAG